jgi:hypothetical protein
MAFEDLAAFISPGFDLPIRGRTYRVPAPNGRDGLYLQALMDGSESLVLTRAVGAANKTVLTDEQERTVYQLALGPAFQEMVDGGVEWPIIKHAGMTAWLRWTRGDEASERFWASLGGSGKAQEPDLGPTSAGTPPGDQSTPSPA